MKCAQVMVRLKNKNQVSRYAQVKSKIKHEQVKVRSE